MIPWGEPKDFCEQLDWEMHMCHLNGVLEPCRSAHEYFATSFGEPLCCECGHCPKFMCHLNGVLESLRSAQGVLPQIYESPKWGFGAPSFSSLGAAPNLCSKNRTGSYMIFPIGSGSRVVGLAKVYAQGIPGCGQPRPTPKKV